MKLTGKCKEDFEMYLKKEYGHLLMRSGEDKTYLYDLLKASHINKIDSLLNSVIIEFFDSTWIYVNVLRYNDKWKMIIEGQFRYTFDSRQEALNEAILKANQLYNENITTIKQN